MRMGVFCSEEWGKREMAWCSLGKTSDFTGNMKSDLDVLRNWKYEKNGPQWGQPALRETAGPVFLYDVWNLLSAEVIHGFYQKFRIL